MMASPLAPVILALFVKLDKSLLVSQYAVQVCRDSVARHVTRLWHDPWMFTEIKSLSRSHTSSREAKGIK